VLFFLLLLLLLLFTCLLLNKVVRAKVKVEGAALRELHFDLHKSRVSVCVSIEHSLCEQCMLCFCRTLMVVGASSSRLLAPPAADAAAAAPLRACGGM
jgi:hypothetical protein